jgi:hypothetical protein
MADNIKNLLDEEIVNKIKELPNLNVGSKELSMTINDLAVLYRLRIDENKNDLEAKEKRERREMEERLKTQEENTKLIQLSEQTKDRYTKIGIAAAELVIPLMFYGIWMKKGFKFEETGAYTSTTFKGLFNRFRPTKK